MRRQSKKRAALMRVAGPQRKAFVESVGACMVCRQRNAVDCHEIVNSAGREKCLTEWRLVMALCRQCHEIVQPLPPAEQIALRHKWEITQDCLLFCDLDSKAHTYVEYGDVLDAMIRGYRRSLMP